LNFSRLHAHNFNGDFLKSTFCDLISLCTQRFNYRPPGALPKTCKKLGVVIDNFAQEGRKFSCLRTIGRYGGGRSCRYARQRALAICWRRAVMCNEWHTCTCFNELFVTAHDILNTDSSK